jgi:hypothetical protein
MTHIYDDPAGVVSLRLWTAANNGPIVSPPGDIWAWRTMVDDVDWEKSRSIHQSNLAILPAETSSSKSGGFGEANEFSTK